MPDDWKEWSDESGYNENLIMLDESGIRDINAKFDPSKKNSANILAGAAGGGIIASLLAQQQQTGQ
jgi:hypothetical protein